MPCRQTNDECGPCSRRAMRSDASPMALDDFAAEGKPDSGTAIFFPVVQSLERGKDTIQVGFLETDPVILEENPANVITQTVAVDLHRGFCIPPLKFQSIAD